MDGNLSFYSKQTNQMKSSGPSKASFTTQVSYLPSASIEAAKTNPPELYIPTFQGFATPTVPVNPMVQLSFMNKPSDSIALRNKFTFMSRTSHFSVNMFMKRPSSLSIGPHVDMNHLMSRPAKAIGAPIFSPFRALPVNPTEYLLQQLSQCSCIRSPTFLAFSHQAQHLPPQFGPHYSSFLNHICPLRNHIDLPIISYLRASRSYTCRNCNVQFPTGQAFGGHMSYHSRIRKSVMAFGEDEDPSRRAKLPKTISLFPEHIEEIGLRPPAGLPMPNSIDLNVSYELDSSFYSSKEEERTSKDDKCMRKLTMETQKEVSVLVNADKKKNLEESEPEAAGWVNKAGRSLRG